MLSSIFALAVLAYSVVTFESAWQESFKAGATSTTLGWFALWVFVLKLRLWSRRRAFHRLG
jgi:hypothetical protein